MIIEISCCGEVEEDCGNFLPHHHNSRAQKCMKQLPSILQLHVDIE